MKGRIQQAGFTYLAMLFAVAIIGIALAGVGVVWSVQREREKEAQLLSIGLEFQKAIGTYYEQSPGAVKRYPHALEDLLKDNRFLSVKRHLRQIYNDPMTGKMDWGLMQAPEGGIMGVYSLSTSSPIKRSNFPPSFLSFENAVAYSDWKFVYRPLSTRIGTTTY
jgi:type II secretory pathway pseudopilin PulG